MTLMAGDWSHAKEKGDLQNIAALASMRDSVGGRMTILLDDGARFGRDTLHAIVPDAGAEQRLGAAPSLRD
jgi:isopentenyl diphosphate isomerase/L-lactate dehydrogenase-like FMN-dependent dehydrogenase